MAECVGRAENAGDLPKVLQAYEAIRKPRVDFFVQRGRFNASVSHLPDGEKQKERDERLRNLGGIIPNMKSWDGKNVDDPPSEPFGPKISAYINGFDILDYVSYTPLSSNRRTY